MTDQKFKLVPANPTKEMIEAAKDRALDFIRWLEVDGADWVDIVKVAIAAAPDLKIRAKPLEWQKGKGAGHNHWSEPHMGLWISFDPEEKPSHRYTAAWGACEPEGFNTLEAAKKYCRDMADSFVRQCAHVGPSAAPEPVCKEPPVAWWNGMPASRLEGTPPSIRWGADAEDTHHDIPLYAGFNPVHTTPPAPKPMCRLPSDDEIREFLVECQAGLIADIDDELLPLAREIIARFGKKVEVVGDD